MKILFLVIGMGTITLYLLALADDSHKMMITAFISHILFFIVCVMLLLNL